MAGYRAPEGGHCEYISERIDGINIKTFKVGDTSDGLVEKYVIVMNISEL